MNLDHIHANKSFLLFQASLEEVSKTTHGKMYKSTEVHMLVKMTQNMVLQDYKPYINDLKLCLFDCVWCYTISYLYCSLRQYNFFFNCILTILFVWTFIKEKSCLKHFIAGKSSKHDWKWVWFHWIFSGQSRSCRENHPLY